MRSFGITPLIKSVGLLFYIIHTTKHILSIHVRILFHILYFDYWMIINSDVYIYSFIAYDPFTLSPRTPTHDSIITQLIIPQTLGVSDVTAQV